MKLSEFDCIIWNCNVRIGANDEILHEVACDHRRIHTHENHKLIIRKICNSFDVSVDKDNFFGYFEYESIETISIEHLDNYFATIEWISHSIKP